MFNVQRPAVFSSTSAATAAEAATPSFGGINSAFSHVQTASSSAMQTVTSLAGSHPPLSDTPFSPDTLSPQMFFPTSISRSAPASPTFDSARRLERLSIPNSPGRCSICSDRATGKHYGANSCDGCKGFFRRTVRKSQRYMCRFSRDCLIDKDKRNSCRYCRFKKCLDAGMKADAVQNERDRISSRKAAPEANVSGEAKSQIEVLRKAETIYQSLRSSVITYQLPCESMPMQLQKQASAGDVAESMKQQLLLLVDWAKSVPEFAQLPLDDQVALLRAYGAQHLLFGVARRSLYYNDVLVLSNESYVLRRHGNEIPEIKTLDELVSQMKELDIDETECICLKAVVFFNPYVHGVRSRAPISEMRQSVVTALEQYLQEKCLVQRGRFGSLLLLLPPLQAIAQQMVESIHLASLFGIARLDNLLQEMLLSGSDMANVNVIERAAGAALVPAEAEAATAVASGTRSSAMGALSTLASPSFDPQRLIEAKQERFVH